MLQVSLTQALVLQQPCAAMLRTLDHIRHLCEDSKMPWLRGKIANLVKALEVEERQVLATLRARFKPYCCRRVHQL